MQISKASVAVSFDGNCIASSFTAPVDTVGTVAVIQYNPATGEWTQLGPNVVPAKYSCDLSMSDDGSRLAVACHDRFRLRPGREEGSFNGMLVFSCLNGTWSQIGQAIAGDLSGVPGGGCVSPDSTRLEGCESLSLFLVDYPFSMHNDWKLPLTGSLMQR